MSPKTSPSNKWQPLPAAEFAKIMAQLEREDGTASNPIAPAVPAWADEIERRREQVRDEMLAVSDLLRRKAAEALSLPASADLKTISAALSRAGRRIRRATRA